MELVGRTALVTGGGSGLGRASALVLFSGGANVVCLDINEERAGEVVRSMEGRGFAVVGDVTDAAAVDDAVAATISRFGSVDIVVNCAGIMASGHLLSRASGANFARVIEVNLVGTFNVLRAAALHMVSTNPDATEERGVIINTASIAAWDGQGGQAAYAASKAGVVGLTLPIARDLAPSKIRCVAIAPGVFSTPMLDDLPVGVQRGLSTHILHPARPGDPMEFALLVRHIVENPYLNAEVIRLDGGLRMNASPVGKG